MKGLNIIVVGTGMYSCGRGTDGFGTIMPAIFQWAKGNSVGEVFIVGTDPKGAAIAKDKVAALKKVMNIELAVRCMPSGTGTGARHYMKAIEELDKPACAIVAVPDNLHGRIAKDTIRFGLHTLVVKPLAPTLKEVGELVAAQRRSNVYCAVELHKRYDEANMMLKEAITSSRLGDPLYFMVEFSQRKSIPSEAFVKWAEKTNVFQYLGVHYVDIIRFATGAIPLRVMATGQKGWLASRGIDTYDSIQAVIEWRMPSGKVFSSHIMVNWIDPVSTSAMSDQKIKVIGTKGRFESDQKKRGLSVITDDNGIEEPNPYFCIPYGPEGAVEYRGYGIDSICRFLDDVAAVERGDAKISDLERSRPTFRQSVIPTAILEAVSSSLIKKSEWIGIKGLST